MMSTVSVRALWHSWCKRRRSHPQGAPSRKVLVAAKVLMATRWTHREAAVAKREKSVAMPSKLGKNWGANPPATHWHTLSSLSPPCELSNISGSWLVLCSSVFFATGLKRAHLISLMYSHFNIPTVTARIVECAFALLQVLLEFACVSPAQQSADLTSLLSGSQAG